jgi:ABC-type nitrate/sulfonate/bicarbonate transport system permease component
VRAWTAVTASALGRLLCGLVPLLLGLAVWQLVGDPASPLFPTPSSWWTALRELNDQGVLMPAVIDTLKVFLLSFALAVTLGAAVGLLVGSSEVAARALGPLFEFFRILPAPTIVPVAALVIGPSMAMSVIVVTFAAIWPVLLNTSSSVRSIPSVRLAMAQTLRLTRAARVFKVLLPSVVPGIALGASIAAPQCFIVTLVVQLLSSVGGLGQLLLQAQRSFDSPAVFALLVVIAALGVVLNQLISLSERHALRNWGGRT